MKPKRSAPQSRLTPVSSNLSSTSIEQPGAPVSGVFQRQSRSNSSSESEFSDDFVPGVLPIAKHAIPKPLLPPPPPLSQRPLLLPPPPILLSSTANRIHANVLPSPTQLPHSVSSTFVNSSFQRGHSESPVSHPSPANRPALPTLTLPTIPIGSQLTPAVVPVVLSADSLRSTTVVLSKPSLPALNAGPVSFTRTPSHPRPPDEEDEESLSEADEDTEEYNVNGGLLSSFQPVDVESDARYDQFTSNALLSWMEQYREEHDGEDNPAYHMIVNIHELFLSVRFWTDLTFSLGVVGLLLMILGRELEYHHPGKYSDSVTWIRIAMSVSTFLLTLSITMLYRIESKSESLHRNFLNRIDCWPTSWIITFCFEIAICLIHDPPSLVVISDIATVVGDSTKDTSLRNGEVYYVENVWSLLMFARLYLIVRLVIARYYPAGPKILGRWCHFDFNTVFALRNMFESHAFRSFTVMIITVIFSFSYCYWVCERSAGGKHATYSGAIWTVVLTLPTVGYGDIVTATSCGRVIAMLTALVGVTSLASLFSSFNEFLSLAPYQMRMVELIDFFELKSKMRESAASVIALFWKHVQAKRSKKLIAVYYHYRLISEISTFFNFRGAIRTFNTKFDTSQFMRVLLEDITSNVTETADMLIGTDRDQFVRNPIVSQLIFLFSRRKPQNEHHAFQQASGPSRLAKLASAASSASSASAVSIMSKSSTSREVSGVSVHQKIRSRSSESPSRSPRPQLEMALLNVTVPNEQQKQLPATSMPALASSLFPIKSTKLLSVSSSESHSEAGDTFQVDPLPSLQSIANRAPPPPALNRRISIGVGRRSSIMGNRRSSVGPVLTKLDAAGNGASESEHFAMAQELEKLTQMSQGKRVSAFVRTRIEELTKKLLVLTKGMEDSPQQSPTNEDETNKDARFRRVRVGSVIDAVSVNQLAAQAAAALHCSTGPLPTTVSAAERESKLSIADRLALADMKKQQVPQLARATTVRAPLLGIASLGRAERSHRGMRWAGVLTANDIAQEKIPSSRLLMQSGPPRINPSKPSDSDASDSDSSRSSESNTNGTPGPTRLPTGSLFENIQPSPVAPPGLRRMSTTKTGPQGMTNQAALALEQLEQDRIREELRRSLGGESSKPNASPNSDPSRSDSRRSTLKPGLRRMSTVKGPSGLTHQAALALEQAEQDRIRDELKRSLTGEDVTSKRRSSMRRTSIQSFGVDRQSSINEPNLPGMLTRADSRGKVTPISRASSVKNTSDPSQSPDSEGSAPIGRRLLSLDKNISSGDDSKVSSPSQGDSISRQNSMSLTFSRRASFNVPMSPRSPAPLTLNSDGSVNSLIAELISVVSQLCVDDSNDLLLVRTFESASRAFNSEIQETVKSFASALTRISKLESVTAADFSISNSSSRLPIKIAAKTQPQPLPESESESESESDQSTQSSEEESSEEESSEEESSAEEQSGSDENEHSDSELHPLKQAPPRIHSSSQQPTHSLSDDSASGSDETTQSSTSESESEQTSTERSDTQSR